MGLLASPLFAKADLSQLRYCPSGGAPCPEELHREWLEKTGQPMLEGWGMTEGAPFCLNPVRRQAQAAVGRQSRARARSCKSSISRTATRVLPLGERGEVRVRGPQMMRGYRNQPEETARDVARRLGATRATSATSTTTGSCSSSTARRTWSSSAASTSIRARSTRCCSSIRRFARRRPSASATPRLGEVLVAFVVLDAGATLTEDEFFEYCKTEMVKYKRPVEVHFVDALPKTGTNKINRLALRERV